jgi:hypothetical protein
MWVEHNIVEKRLGSLRMATLSASGKKFELSRKEAAAKLAASRTLPPLVVRNRRSSPAIRFILRPSQSIVVPNARSFSTLISKQRPSE